MTSRKIVAWCLLPPAALLVILFAIANRAPVAIDLDPLPFALAVPLYVVVMGAILLGIVIGGLSSWAAAGKWRRRVREQRRESLRREATPAPRTDVVPAIAPGPAER